MSNEFIRAQMLLSQGRTEMAERELRRILSENPDDATAHSMLALSMIQDQNRYQEATDEAQRAVALEPDVPYGHYVLSIVLLKRNRHKLALAAIEQAIEIDPYDEDYFGQLASVQIGLRNWQAALDAAESGLEIDPEDSLCNNIRSIALERLGRSEDAIESAAQSLKNDPDDSYSHSAFGWTLLNGGKHKEAQDAFREALRLDPTNEMAREGMINALNSRSFVFRAIHKFHIGLSRLSHKYQFGLIFGLWVLVMVLQRVGQNLPWLAPFIPILVMGYMAFVILTWTSNAVFNTVLRFHPFGQHLLNRKEIWTSNLVATCFISGTVGSIYGFFVGGLMAAIVIAFYWMLMCVPATVPFLMPTAKRALMIGIAGIIVGLVPVYGVLQSTMSSSITEFVASMRTFNWSIIGLQVASNFMVVTPDRQ